MSGSLSVERCRYVFATQREENLEEESIIDAATNNDTNKLLRLLRMGYDPNEQDGAGYTPLHWVARHNNVEAIAALVEAGANPYIKNCREFTPIREAALFSRRVAVKSLLGAYEKFNKRDSRLPEAVKNNNIARLLELFEESVNLLSKDASGKTALELAIQKKKNRTASAIIQYCDLKGIKLEEGPLHDAVRYNDINALVIMLKEGAFVEDRDVYLKTPLLLAATFNRTNIMNVLLEAGADPRSTNNVGETALHLAVRTGSSDAVTLLLRSDVDVNAQTIEERKTPLHYANRFHPELMDLLQEHGANTFIIDAKGRDCRSKPSEIGCGPIDV